MTILGLVASLFLGDEGVIGVQAWVKSCERMFRFMDLTDLQKVQIASSHLQERASDWYELLTIEITEEILTWDQFRKRFERKFLPDAKKATMYKQFIDLEQNIMFVQEYVMTF